MQSKLLKNGCYRVVRKDGYYFQDSIGNLQTGPCTSRLVDSHEKYIKIENIHSRKMNGIQVQKYFNVFKNDSFTKIGVLDMGRLIKKYSVDELNESGIWGL